MSSYELFDGGMLRTISGSVADDQLAACWVLVSDDGRFAYTANAGSDSLSGYAIRRDGALSLLDDDGVTASTPQHPTDIAQPGDVDQLFVLGSSALGSFRLHHDGSLSPVDVGGGVPTSSAGLVAR